MNRELTVAPYRVAWLVQLLNVSESTNRVAELLRCCQQLESLKDEGPQSVSYLESPEGIRRGMRKYGLLHTVNDVLLSDCRFRPAVRVDYDITVRWLPTEPKVTKAQIDAWRDSDHQLEKAPIPEIAGIQIVLELAGSGLLDRVRQCPAPNAERPGGVCGKWFYAVRNKKVVCSETCRSRKYQADPQHKQKHVENMRWYRKRNPGKRELADAAESREL